MRACVCQKKVVPLQPILKCLTARVNIEDLKILFGQHPELAAVRKELAHRDAHVLLSGLHASTRALALAHLQKPLFVIFDNAENAQYLYADLKAVGADTMFFPAAKRRRTIDDAATILRTETLTALAANKVQIVVTYPEAIAEPVPAKEELSAVSMTLKVGQEIQQSELSKQLSELGFEHVDFVFQPGQYAIRGSIVDIYSYGHDIPYRFDFFGDEIDSIREFDIEDQLSKSRVESAEIVGGSQESKAESQESTVVDYLTEDFVWVSNDWGMAKFKAEGLINPSILNNLNNRKTIEIAEKSSFDTHSKISFDTIPQPVFHKQFDILTEDLRKHINNGYNLYLSRANEAIGPTQSDLRGTRCLHLVYRYQRYVARGFCGPRAENMLLHRPSDLRAFPSRHNE